MEHTHGSLTAWFENLLANIRFRKYCLINAGTLQISDFEADGPILDIGGGGEGVIGRLKGQQVIAIDLRQEELDEAPDGPQKIVMDARNLDFPDGYFAAATAFFSLMYMKTREDHQKVFQEAWRTLKPGGHLYIWDVDLSSVNKRKKEAYLVRLRYRIGEFERGTAYGVRWPDAVRDEAYYLELARSAGFQLVEAGRFGNVLHLIFTR